MTKTVTIPDAVEILRGGGVLLVPTETVVGLVCTEEGLPRVYELKGRDENKPVALLCRSTEEAFSLAASVSDLALTLSERFWPGSLTLVLKFRNGGNVGLRVPLGTVREVLEAYGGSLYATSANPSGAAAPRSLDEVERGIVEGVDGVVEGEGGGGEASAVVDLTGDEPRIIRASEKLDEAKLREMRETLR